MYSVYFGIWTGILFSYMKSKELSDSSTFIKMLIVFLTFFLVTFIGGLSLLIRDVAYPSRHPWKFAIETLLMGVIPASTLFIFYYLRGSAITITSIYAFILFACKCMIVHLLLQFSGVYSSIFKHSSF